MDWRIAAIGGSTLWAGVKEVLHLPWGRRRFRAHCVGAPKSGTHSIAAVFRHYRAAHEPDSSRFLAELLRYLGGAIGPSAMRRILRARDQQWRLEMESAHFNVYVVDLLAELFPEARFLLPVRDCYSWIDSFINHQLSRPIVPGSPWARYRDARMGAGRYTHALEERALAERGLYTLDGYFSYWAMHNQRVLDAVPACRLLIFRTADIDRQLPRIAEFVGVPVETLDAGAVHSYPAASRFNLVSQIDPCFVRAKAEVHCKALMERFFPEVAGPGIDLAA